MPSTNQVPKKGQARRNLLSDQAKKRFNRVNRNAGKWINVSNVGHGVATFPNSRLNIGFNYGAMMENLHEVDMLTSFELVIRVRSTRKTAWTDVLVMGHEGIEDAKRFIRFARNSPEWKIAEYRSAAPTTEFPKHRCLFNY